MDFLHAVFDDVLQHPRDRRRCRRIHRRLLVDPDRAQLHRHHSQDARARLALVSPATVRLGPICDQRHSGAGHAGAGHDPGAIGARTRTQGRHFRSGPRRRSAPVPALVLVLFPPCRVHHGAAGDGCSERDRRLLRAPPDLRLSHDGLRDHRHRHDWLHGMGSSHVCLRPITIRRDGVFHLELSGCHSFGDQGVQLDRDALPRQHLVRSGRCSTR